MVLPSAAVARVKLPRDHRTGQRLDKGRMRDEVVENEQGDDQDYDEDEDSDDVDEIHEDDDGDDDESEDDGDDDDDKHDDGEQDDSRTSIFPVTAAAISAARYSRQRSMDSRTLAISASILAVCRSKWAAIALCSELGGRQTSSGCRSFLSTPGTADLPENASNGRSFSR